MVTWFYMGVFILSLIMLGRVLIINKKADTMLVIALLLLVVNCMGRYMLAVSDSLASAVLANKIIYVGACYLPLCFLFILSRLCSIKIPRFLAVFLTAYSCFIMGAVLTIGKSKLYYKSVELGYGNGYNYLIKTYGPLHGMYIAMIVVYVGIMVFYMIYAIKQRNKISLRTVVTMSGIGCSVLFMYIFERLIGSSISFLALGYMVGIALLITHYERLNMYDMSENVYNAIEKLNEYGYIAFDSKYRYINSNHLIKELFPEIKDWGIDKEVPVSDSYIYKEVVKYLLEWDGKDSVGKFINVNDNFLQVSVRYILYGRKRRVGYLLEFVDRSLEKKYYNAIEEYNASMEKEVVRKTEELIAQQDRTKQLFVQTVTALSEAVDAKDRYTSGHSKRVAMYARMIAEKMGKSKEEQDEIYRAGLLHDMGKIRISAEIINKPGKLTDEEFDIIKIHPVTGYHILRGISDENCIAIAAKYHHERYDGKGYPNGLSGENIPEVARILGVADSYDAMASNRSYRNALPQEVVKSEILKGKGTQFDPYIADIMLQMIDEDKDYTMQQADTMQRSILVVDDEMMNHKLITYIMRDEPMYEIVAVEGGREALDVLGHKDFDLILLDLRMPGIDGLETLKLIREKYQTPVVLMTADKTLDTSAEFSKLGCDDYITKPILPLLLKEVVHNMTERTKDIG